MNAGESPTWTPLLFHKGYLADDVYWIIADTRRCFDSMMMV